MTKKTILTNQDLIDIEQEITIALGLDKIEKQIRFVPSAKSKKVFEDTVRLRVRIPKSLVPAEICHVI